jgi:hypothetical protein
MFRGATPQKGGAWRFCLKIGFKRKSGDGPTADAYPPDFIYVIFFLKRKENENTFICLDFLS